MRFHIKPSLTKSCLDVTVWLGDNQEFNKTGISFIHYDDLSVVSFLLNKREVSNYCRGIDCDFLVKFVKKNGGDTKSEKQLTFILFKSIKKKSVLWF